jgi:hypothetical protein
MSVTDWLAVSEVVLAIWVLDGAQVIVSDVGGMVFIAVDDCDVAAVTGGSGYTGGCRVGCDAMGWFVSECHCLLGAGGCFEAGDKAVGAVVLYFNVFAVSAVVGRRLVWGFICLDPVSVSGVR